jgi:hypothetical protein
MKRLGFAVIALALAVGSIMGTVAQETGSRLADLGFPELRISSDGSTVTFDQSEIPAGRYHLVFENTGPGTAFMEIYMAPEGVPIDEILAALEAVDMGEGSFEVLYRSKINGGVTAVASGESGNVVLDMDAGEWLVNVNHDDDGGEGIPTISATIMVSGEAAEEAVIAVDVTASMYEYGFKIEGNPKSGVSLWELTTIGAQPHHIVIYQVPDGTTEAEFMGFMEMMMSGPPEGSPEGMPATPELGDSPTAMGSPMAGLDPAQVVEVGFSAVISTGRSNWVEFDLPAGTYVAVCFIPDFADGMPHIMKGMAEMFTVE